MWGESAVPYFLSIFWFLENFTGGAYSESLPITILTALCRSNIQGSTTPLADPYKSLDDILGDAWEKPRAGQVSPPKIIACRSYALESLILLLTRRLRRQFLSGIWSGITKVEMAEFRPTNVHDLLLWDCDNGEERHSWPARPGIWQGLKQKAGTVNLGALPQVVRGNPIFALLFLLAYPHRLGTNLVQFLDKALT